MIQMEDEEEADFILPPCQRFSSLISKPGISGLLHCTVCALDCLTMCDFNFVLKTLVPGIKKLLSSPNMSVIESMLLTLPDFCEVLAENFPNQAGHLLITEFIPETCHVIERVGDSIGDAAAESFAAILTLCTQEDFEEFELPVLKQFLFSKKKEIRIIISQVLSFIADYFPCDNWFDQLYGLLSALMSDGLGSVRSSVPSLISLYAQKLFDDSKKLQLVSCFQLFCRDKSILVRKSAAESLVSLSQALDENMRIITIIPAADMLLNDSVDAVRSVIIRNLGPLISTIGPSVDSKLVSRFTDALTSADQTIAYASAFAFPAVALAVGRSRWNELKDSFDLAVLSHDFRVRRTLAFGLLSFGFIIEPEELCNIACGFLRDLPGVAVGVITSLHQLLNTIVACEKSQSHLQAESITQENIQKNEEIKNDQENNSEGKNSSLIIESLSFCLQNPSTKYREWRVRLHVSQQLRYCAEFFNRQMLLKSALELVEDDVAAVRNDAATSLAFLLMSESNLPDISLLAGSERYQLRIAAARILGETDPSIALKGLDILKKLCEDPVPSVRAAAVKAASSLSRKDEARPFVSEIVEKAVEDVDLGVREAVLREM